MDLDEIVRANLGPIAAGLAVAVFLLLVLAIVEARRIGRLSRRIAALTRGSDERSLEAILEAHLARVHEVVRDLDQVEARTAVLERDLKRAFSRIGLVRFNPFEDTGGNQSFALALLDANGDGFVVSSLHARNMTRVYAKAVTGGKSDAALSDEEARALAIATSPAGGTPA
ncbi:MAG TPA: DUF4446 family protein [Candidatus Limnocylindrales bacterium]|nr:DUF4446 family protein [Candidatus Limnocylindrales bacterium]